MHQRLQDAADRLPPRVRSAGRLAVATIRDSISDRVPGLAAEIAFWVLLSLPSVLLAAVSMAGLIGDRLGGDVRAQLITRIQELALQVFTDGTVEATIRPTLDALLEGGSGSVLSLSFLATVYSVSRVLRVVVLAIAIAYDLETARPTWVSRILGFAYTLVALVVGLALIPIVVAGPRLGEILESRLGMDLMLAEIYAVAYWPLSLLVVTLLIATLYHFGAPWRTPFRRELPGAALATTLALLSSLGLRTYTGIAFGGDGLYASLAAPLAILIWVWLQGIALLVGAELNAEIEKADPVGQPAPETSPITALGRRAVAKVRSFRGSSGTDRG